MVSSDEHLYAWWGLEFYCYTVLCLQYVSPVYNIPAYTGGSVHRGAPNLTYSNPYIDNPKGDYKWGTMYDHAEQQLERRWKTYFGASSRPLSAGRFVYLHTYRRNTCLAN